jgi:N-acetylmuramoyl-L-alanine amidase
MAIKAIVKSYMEQAKEQFELQKKDPKLKGSLPTTPSGILKYFKDEADRLYKEALKEAEKSEDEDLVIIEEVIEEDCPICLDEQKLREYIRSQKETLTRKIKWLSIHCTATPVTATVASIRNYWRKKLGWKNDGYHIVFPYEGGFTVLADFNTICNSVQGFNSNGLGYSYIGGIDKNGKPIDNRSESQKRLMKVAVEETRLILEEIGVKGHYEFGAKKACPCFKASEEYKKVA